MTKRTCTMPQCERKHQARGMCTVHYKTWYLKTHPHVDPNPKREVPCTVCGKTVRKARDSRRRPVCSYKCRDTLVHGEARAQRRLDATAITTTPPKQHLLRLALLDAAIGHWVHGTATTTRFLACTCLWCGEAYTWDLRVGGNPARYCTRRCARRAAKRYRARGAIPDRTREAIYKRDNWICQLCGEPTSRTYSPQDMKSPTLDHIIPQSHQLLPDHSETNLRLSHLICNSLRGDRVA